VLRGSGLLRDCRGEFQLDGHGVSRFNAVNCRNREGPNLNYETRLSSIQLAIHVTGCRRALTSLRFLHRILAEVTTLHHGKQQMPAINRVLLSGEVYSPTRAGCSPSPKLTVFQALDYTGHMPHLDPQLLPIAHRLSDWTCFTIGGVVLKTRPACPATTTTQHEFLQRPNINFKSGFRPPNMATPSPSAGAGPQTNRDLFEKLPVELFDMILDLVAHHNDPRSVNTLGRLNRVSGSWYNLLFNRMYCRWSYDGDIHSILSLWQFLRSVLNNSRIANCVGEVDMRNWTLDFMLRPRRGFFGTHDAELELAGDAAGKLGLHRVLTKADGTTTSWEEALGKADPRPMVALLLASLRNLEKLYFEIPSTDPFLDAILERATTTSSSSRILKNLSQAYLAGARNYPPIRGYPDLGSPHPLLDSSSAASRHVLDWTQVARFHLLPKLIKLSLCDVRLGGAAGVLSSEHYEGRACHIRELTMVLHELASETRAADMLAILSFPRALTSLSIWLSDGDNDPDNPNAPRKNLSNGELWPGIQRHQDTLERLNLYRKVGTVDPTPELPMDDGGIRFFNTSHFGSMQFFSSLKHIMIQPEVLIGGYQREGDEEMTQRLSLKDTLPAGLACLTLFGDQGLATDPTLGEQARQVLGGGGSLEIRLALRRISLEIRTCETWTASYIGVVQETAQNACREGGFRVKYEPLNSLQREPSAWVGLIPHHKHLLELRSDPDFESSCSLRDSIVYTHYCELLGHQYSGTGYNSNDASHLSCGYEDLDTYELQVNWENPTDFF